MSVHYIDTSAALKLIVEETHSKAFAAYYDSTDTMWVSSSLLRIEITRAVTRVMPAAIPDAHDLLLAFDYVGIGDSIVEAAMNEPDRTLRSLDAIHLATARVLAADLDAIVTYDDRLATAAEQAGFSIISPRG